MLSFLKLYTLLAAGSVLVAGQQIYDVYTTTWSGTSLFTYTNLGNNPVDFGTPGPDGAATISISDNQVFQTINGFGATLTDTAASTLLGLKSISSTNYWNLLNTLFDPNDAHQNAGFSFLRVPIGATDFSSSVYSLMSSSSFSSFSVGPENNIIAVIKDILTINNILQIHLVPWSPPAFMKTNLNMIGGGINPSEYSAYAQYLFDAVSGFTSALGGHKPYSVTIQNEPQNGDTTYPTCTMSVDDMGQVGNALRSLLNNNGFGGVYTIGYEHNWDNAATYPVQLMQKYGNAFRGVAFHCYEGDYTNMESFTSAFPSKWVYQTECSGIPGTDWWSDIKWYTDKLTIGSIAYGAQTAMMWNLAANAQNGPLLPGSDSCPGGCRPMVTVSGGQYTLNQEFYALAHAQKAVLPKDVGGPLGKRIGVSVGGGTGWGLRVGAYVTGRVSSSEWYRYSLVVLNWDDSSSTAWNPQAVQTTINFRGLQASYTFPVGLTTLSWYASQNGYARRAENGTVLVDVEHESVAQPPIQANV